jgi:hypothetical protein
MTKRLTARRVVVLLIVPVVVLLLPTGYPVVLGLARHEHFYAGRPTNYWSWRVRMYRHSQPPPAAIERLMNGLGLGSPPAEPPVLHGGAVAVPVLVDLLKDEARSVRWESLGALMKTGPEAEAALPALLVILRDRREHHITREGAVIALVHTDQEQGVTACLEVLREEGREDLSVRLEAIRLLKELGPDARKAVPAMTEALRDPEQLVREEAAAALERIDPEAAAEAGIR